MSNQFEKNVQVPTVSHCLSVCVGRKVTLSQSQSVVADGVVTVVTDTVAVVP